MNAESGSRAGPTQILTCHLSCFPLFIARDSFANGYRYPINEPSPFLSFQFSKETKNCNRHLIFLVLFRSTNFERKAFLAEPIISTIYFQPPVDPNVQNIRSYLPPELQHQVPVPARTGTVPLLQIHLSLSIINFYLFSIYFSKLTR